MSENPQCNIVLAMALVGPVRFPFWMQMGLTAGLSVSPLFFCCCCPPTSIRKASSFAHLLRFDLIILLLWPGPFNDCWFLCSNHARMVIILGFNGLGFLSLGVRKLGLFCEGSLR